ncbi:MAG: sulfite exporter TauE/SafE family protein [Bacteroidetes bacterium]|nr:sulfite exporter TauE/SafE family protein [Bacteroidota bacterium]
MDIFNIYLPVAGIEFNVVLLILIGFCVGVLGGFFGVGGGWIVTPALNIFGFHMAFAIGTDLSNIFGQTIGAVKKHQKMGNIDWKLGLISIATSIVGLEIGSDVIIALEKAGDVGMIVRWCYMLLLWGLGSYMLHDYFATRPKEDDDIDRAGARTPANKSGQQKPGISERLHRITLSPMVSFPASGIDEVSIWIILLIFLFTGFLSGFLGVGGGFIIMPALVYLIGLPTAVAVGTSLVTVLFSGAYGCLTYALKGRVEIIAAMIMLIGASIGAQVGSTAVKYIKGYGIRLLFSVMIIFAGFSVATEQAYKITQNQTFQTFAGVVLMGTALSMSVIIIGKLVADARKERDKSSIIKKHH